MVSIYSNLAAYAAQGNIAKANDAASGSISRLSSGQRIVKASDDVAGLSVGTVLATGITTLKQALSNASQGTSLLQVADGALSQISDILTRQKAIATQANSGTLSDTDRSYLNQEFQALTAQIDQISGATSFSSVKLLDGSLSGAKDIVTNTNIGTAAANAANVTTAGMVLTVGGAPVAGETLNVNGVVITFAATGAGVGTTSSAGKVIIGGSDTATAQNIVAYLNSSTDARLSNLVFTNSAGVISASYIGGALAGSYVVAASTSATNVTAGSVVNRTIASNANNLDGVGYGKTVALGSTTGSLLVNGDTAAANSGQAISTLAVVNNKDFIGKLGQGSIGKITGAYTATDTAVLSLKVGDYTYTTGSQSFASGGAITFTGVNSAGVSGGSFTLNFKTAGFTFSDPDTLNNYITQINAALAGVTFAQNRDVNSFTSDTIATVGSVQVGTLQGASINLRSHDFTNVTLQALSIIAPTNGATDAIIKVTIDGEEYQSIAGLGTQIARNTSITLQNLADPTKAFTIQTGNTPLSSSSTVALDLSTQANADAIVTALKSGFGLDGSSAALNLQVGARSTDTIGVQINNTSSSNLFKNKQLDITTIAGAQEASAATDAALSTVNATRATVGALQSRFNFTAANLQSSISNQDSARSVLLDTDVTGESTKFSTSQVQLQAGIAVLAQANQLTQNLLKLLQ